MADITNNRQKLTFKVKVPTEQEIKEAKEAFGEGGRYYKYRHLIKPPAFEGRAELKQVA